MDYQGTPLIYDSEGESFSTLQTWVMALTKPDEETYARLIHDPKAGIGRAILWVLVSNFIGISIFAFVYMIVAGLSILTQFPELREVLPEAQNFLGGSLLLGLLCIPVWSAVGLITFLGHTGIVHFVAGALGGMTPILTWSMLSPRTQLHLHWFTTSFWQSQSSNVSLCLLDSMFVT